MKFSVLAMLGVALRVALWWAVPHMLAGDAWHNDQITLNLIAGHGFSHSTMAPWYPDALRSPAYNFLMLLPCYLFYGAGLVPFAQMALDVATGWLLYRMVAEDRGERAALWATGLFFLAPYEAIFSTLELTETLTTFLIAWWWWALRRNDYGAAFLGGLLILCRPVLGPLAVLAPCLARSRRPWPARLAIYVLVPLAVISPWMVRNELSFGRPTFGSPASLGVSLYLGAVMDDNVHLTDEGQAEMAMDGQQWNRRSNMPAAMAVALDDRLKAIALAAMRRHPGAWGVHVVRQAIRLWWAADDGVADYAPDVPMSRLVALATVLPWCQRALLLLALFGLWRGPRQWAVVPLIFTLCYAPIHVEPRFAVPAETALCALAAQAVTKKGEPVVRPKEH
ncbi:MAG TPA: hypothetical protein VGO93_25370 [Candidatus Xenobia bacterium]